MAEQRGKRYALIIACNEYDDSEIPPLKTPVKEAERLKVILENPDIGYFNEVKLLKNNTFINVRKEIYNFFRDKESDDLLLLYFSGHGLVDDELALYFAVKDTKKEELEITGIKTSEIKKWMKNSFSSKQILLLDCCYSGAFHQTPMAGIIKVNGDKNFGISKEEEHLEEGEGRVVLTSSDDVQLSYEGQEYSNFTQVLIEGLESGEASKDSVISVDDLFDYILKSIKKKNKKQTPTKWGEVKKGRLIIAKKPVFLSRSSNYMIKDYMIKDGYKKLLKKFFKVFLIIFMIIICISVILNFRGYLKAFFSSPIKTTIPTIPIKLAVPTPSLRSVITPEFITPDMVLIEGGKYKMGNKYADHGEEGEKYEHRVEVSSFYIGKYEVTNKEYKLFKSDHKGKWSDDDYPVEMVNWYDIVAYCNWLSDKVGLERCYSGSEKDIVCDFSKNGYRLPTEAEWEYACRAGTSTKYYWGNIMDGEYCWYDANSEETVHPIGERFPNKWGLYDMSGNVVELCWDCYDKSYYENSPFSNPTGPNFPESGRIVRGGSWRYQYWDCYSFHRGAVGVDERLYYVGFRLAKSYINLN